MLTRESLHVWDQRNALLPDAQKGCPARPQRVKGRGVPSGARGATNKEHQGCARRRVVRRLGLRGVSERCENVAWEKARLGAPGSGE